MVLLAFGLLACDPEVFSIAIDATETASAVFKQAKDDARVKRDEVASKRMGELSVGPRALTAKELQPLKALVAAAKADGEVTLEEADTILVEMERVVTLRAPKSR